ncbi:hypothetical protein [Phytomonospora endophytica]|uniref:Uncharacterized protein n=1 Tax=Phytomonospora endophytica TaxID=714109 RepID=A0A841FM01_9ACTN|nr:hypothetical protein [Phytomonospora endophytica]MBB6037025.1 hypothetical protein [Phytomonospora endophytica]GIG69431.1 hypothetical protein Pen01_57260 [Phytomonospora endophytica]
MTGRDLSIAWWNFVVGVGAVWAAAVTVPGVALAGTAGQNALIVVVIAIVELGLSMSATLLPGPPRARLSPGLHRAAGAAVFLGFVVALLGGPIAWLLATVVAGPLGVPFTIDGFLPFLVAPLMVFLLSWLPMQLLGILIDRARWWRLLGTVMRALASAGGFTLMWAIGDFRVEGASGWQTAVALVTLVAVYHAFGWSFAIDPGQGDREELRRRMLRMAPALLLLGYGTDVLVLWATEFLSRFVSVELRFVGVSSLFLGAAVCTLLTWAMNVPFAIWSFNRTPDVPPPCRMVGWEFRAARYGYQVTPIVLDFRGPAPVRIRA